MVKYVGLLFIKKKKKKSLHKDCPQKNILSMLCVLAMVIYRSIKKLQMCTSNNCKNNKQRNVMKWLHNPYFFLLVYHWKAKVNGVSENWGQKTRQIFDIFCQKSINCKLVIQHIPYTPIIQKMPYRFLI